MARKRPFRTFRVDEQICENLEKIMAEEFRHEDLGVFIENQLDLIAHKRYVSVEAFEALKARYEELREDLRGDVREVKAVRVRGGEAHEQRKVS